MSNPKLTHEPRDECEYGKDRAAAGTNSTTEDTRRATNRRKLRNALRKAEAALNLESPFLSDRLSGPSLDYLDRLRKEMREALQ
jgi:hypothetical protein